MCDVAKISIEADLLDQYIVHQHHSSSQWIRVHAGALFGKISKEVVNRNAIESLACLKEEVHPYSHTKLSRCLSQDLCGKTKQMGAENCLRHTLGEVAV